MDQVLCHTCGAANSTDDNYCAHCGVKLEYSSIDENAVVHESVQDNVIEKHDGLENVYSLERSANMSASSFFLKKNEILYKIYENGKNLVIQSKDNKNIGVAIKTGGIWFPDWSLENNNGTLKVVINIHPRFKGELKISDVSGDEVYNILGIKGPDGKGHFMKLTDFQAYNAVNNKMIKIFIPTGIKKGLLTYEPPNNLEIKADTGIDDFIIVGFTAVIVKTFLTISKKHSGFTAGFGAGVLN